MDTAGGVKVMKDEVPLPPVVSEAEWRALRDELLVKEKIATRTPDALAAERRRLPMVRLEGVPRWPQSPTHGWGSARDDELPTRTEVPAQKKPPAIEPAAGITR